MDIAMKEMGQRIKERRKQLNYTLQDVGNRMGCPATTVRRWEEGKTGSIKHTTLLALADILQLDPMYLLTGSHISYVSPIEDPSLTPPSLTFVDQHHEPASEEETELLRIYRALPLKGRISLLSKALELEDEHAEK